MTLKYSKSECSNSTTSTTITTTNTMKIIISTVLMACWCCCNAITLDNPSMSLSSTADDCIPPHCPPPPPQEPTPTSPFLSPWGQLQPHHQHQHQQHHHQQHQQQQSNESTQKDVGLVPRGGAAAASVRAQTPPPPTSNTYRQRHSSKRRRRTPIINPATISLALRLTSEMNRQLKESPPTSSSSSQQQRLPTQEMEAYNNQLSIFHKPNPRPSSSSSSSSSSSKRRKRGIERWGPNLTSYISSLLQKLHCQKNSSLVLILSIIYLDRACSLETPRSNSASYSSSSYSPQQQEEEENLYNGLENVVNGYCPPLPYITPQTVHRLITTAILLAHKAVNPSSSSSSSSSYPFTQALLEEINMSEESLQIMMDWMMNAMGDLGLYVSVDVLEEWMDSWGQIFGVPSHDDMEEEQEEEFVEEQQYYPQSSYAGDQQQQQAEYSSFNNHGNDQDDGGESNNNNQDNYWGNTHETAMSCWS